MGPLSATIRRLHRRVNRRTIAKAVSRRLRALTDNHDGGFHCYCPCCETLVTNFLPHGLRPRPDALCPNCGARERQRLVQLYFKHRTDLFDGRPKRLLDVAPDASLSGIFERCAYLDYLAVDLSPDRAPEVMDITDIHHPDNSFDAIYCSHVLEHVPDDHRAMSELCRVLKPSGWAILQVPIYDGPTVEDPTVTDPKERERRFGQQDHVRRYGSDYLSRLERAGFSVTVDGFVRELGERLIRVFGLSWGEDIYYCRKQSARVTPV